MTYARATAPRSVMPLTNTKDGESQNVPRGHPQAL